MTYSEFLKTINKYQIPVVLVFSASWCAPCRPVKEIISKLASSEWTGKINIIILDVEKETALANFFKVRAVPTVIGIDSQGQVRKVITGARSKSEYQKLGQTLLTTTNRF